MIHVASYNMRKAIGTDRRRRPERTLEVLRELDADVVALQEADRRFGSRMSAIPLHMIDEHSDYKPVRFEARNGSIGWHGNAMLVKKDVEILACELLHLPSLEPRGAVMSEIDVRGEKVRVVGMHLDLSGLWRRRQAHAILTHLAGREEELPTVLMGDLNEWSTQGGCLRDFGHHHLFADCGRSFHARRPIAQLDRIMVSPNLQILESGAHFSAASRKASDHLPIWAKLRRAAAAQDPASVRGSSDVLETASGSSTAAGGGAAEAGLSSPIQSRGSSL
ncbi:MAG TPA: endonuclease/exonuclease/phosphatase family protein [Allosphingosinicella sp.]|nr:endonuclease/exonuclease/phosphatase family protein [Allosphingosinicella sp.]